MHRFPTHPRTDTRGFIFRRTRKSADCKVPRQFSFLTQKLHPKLGWRFREWLERVTGVRPARADFLAVVMVLVFSGFYEVTEGVVAMIGSPDLGMAHLGTQCDQWYAQCDSFLAFAGSVHAMVIALRIAR